MLLLFTIVKSPYKKESEGREGVTKTGEKHIAIKYKLFRIINIHMSSVKKKGRTVRMFVKNVYMW